MNLPTQKEMLAKYRCDEISNEIFATFNEQFQSLKSQLAKGQIIDNFGTKTTQLLTNAMGTISFLMQKKQEHYI